MVQDLATQWIQYYPCKTKTSQEAERSSQKFLEPITKPKFIFTDNSWFFGKAGEDLSWHHCMSTPHRSKTNGIAERAVRRIQKEHLRYCCNRDWTKIGGRIPWNVTATCEIFRTDCLMRKHHTKGDFGEPFKGPRLFHFSLVENFSISTKDQSRIHQFGKKVLPGISLGYVLYAGREDLVKRHTGCGL